MAGAPPRSKLISPISRHYESVLQESCTYGCAYASGTWLLEKSRTGHTRARILYKRVLFGRDQGYPLVNTNTHTGGQHSSHKYTHVNIWKRWTALCVCLCIIQIKFHQNVHKCRINNQLSAVFCEKQQTGHTIQVFLWNFIQLGKQDKREKTVHDFMTSHQKSA